MSYFPGGAPRPIKPETSGTALSFPNDRAYTEGWVYAKAGINNNGPLCIQLQTQDGRAISTVAEVFSSEASLSKFTQVDVKSSETPEIIKVWAVNKSTAENSNAEVLGIWLK